MLKKYRKISLILTGLAGIALLTTGFSAWVIQGTNAATENNMVTINVGTLTDKRLTTTLSSLDKSVTFDSNVDGGINPIKGTGDTEDMVFGGTVKVALSDTSSASITEVLENVNFNLSVASNNDYNNAIGTNKALRVCGLDPNNISAMTYTLEKPGSGWVTEPTANITYHQDGASSKQEDYLRCSYQVTEVNSGSKSITIDFKFGFGRGSVFEYVNPCDAEFTDDSNGSKLTAALSALTDLQKLNSVSNLFTLTVTPNYTGA